MLLPQVELGKIDHSMRLNKVYLEDLSLSCCNRLWLSHLWWNLGNLDFTFLGHWSLRWWVRVRWLWCSVLGVHAWIAPCLNKAWLTFFGYVVDVNLKITCHPWPNLHASSSDVFCLVTSCRHVLTPLLLTYRLITLSESLLPWSNSSPHFGWTLCKLYTRCVAVNLLGCACFIV